MVSGLLTLFSANFVLNLSSKTFQFKFIVAHFMLIVTIAFAQFFFRIFKYFSQLKASLLFETLVSGRSGSFFSSHPNTSSTSEDEISCLVAFFSSIICPHSFSPIGREVVGFLLLIVFLISLSSWERLVEGLHLFGLSVIIFKTPIKKVVFSSTHILVLEYVLSKISKIFR